MFQYALEYRRLGFSVIPLIKGTKRPSVKWAQYQTSRANEEASYMDGLRIQKASIILR